jgi:SAM-dependent methyltransferase
MKRERSGLERRIARGAVAHYEDADYYDAAYRRRLLDVRFYVGLARARGGPVLELGAGSGRVTLALARAGVDVVAVEPVPAMLARAREKALKLPAEARARLTLRRGDARRLALGRTFPLIIAPFNVLMHFYARRDLERLLSVVRRHLKARGRFVFDVAMPDLRSMLRTPGKLYRGPRVSHPRSGTRFDYCEAFEYDAARQVQMVSMIFQNLEKLEDLRSVPLSQRQFFPQELEALLHYNGFALEAHWGDFARAPLGLQSESQVLVAKLRR